eukprot:699959-Amphidinium_carterae.1
MTCYAMLLVMWGAISSAEEEEEEEKDDIYASLAYGLGLLLGHHFSLQNSRIRVLGAALKLWCGPMGGRALCQT